MLRTVPIERLTALATRLLARLKQSRQSKQSTPAHPARAHIHETTTLGNRAADGIAVFAGSWLCVGVHAIWFALWLLLRIDINLLTLIVSLEAIFLATFVLMNQNRQASKDRLRDDTEAAEVEQLFQINQQQLTILEQQNAILALLKAHTAQAQATAATPRKPGRPKKETTAA